jgi:integrase
VKSGSVYQRHTRRCPRDEAGKILPHRCTGTWAYQVDLGRRLDGLRVQAAKGGFTSRNEARAALRDVVRQASATDLASFDVSVGAFLEQWLAAKRTLRPSTVQAYRSHLDLYLVPLLGNIRLRDLRPAHLDELYQVIAGGKRGRPLSPTTLRRIHATLRSALASAVRRRFIQDNPAAHVELPPMHRRSADVWTPEQLGKFLDAVADDRLYALFLLVAMTGLRRGEVIGLRWQDVDLHSGLLRITQQVVELRGQLVVGEPKTRSGVRVVPVDAGTAATLAEHRTKQQHDRRKWGEAWHETGLAFGYEDGRMLRPEYVTRRFQSLARQAGVPVIRFHGLRHTSASLALAAGVPMRVVSDRLGHSSTGITADLYTHVSPAVAGTAADAIAGIVPRRHKTAGDSLPSAFLAQRPDQHPEEDEQ